VSIFLHSKELGSQNFDSPDSDKDSVISSLFGEDDSIEDTRKSAPESKMKVPKNGNGNTTKTKPKVRSRQIILPDDYNKLEIPKLEKVKKRVFFSHVFSQEMLDLLSENGEDLDGFMEPDESVLFTVSIDVKVRGVRDVDEMNGVSQILRFNG
jgi:hypothetical protein